MLATSPQYAGTPDGAVDYHRPTTNASIRKDGAASDNTPISGDMQPSAGCGGPKLLDHFRDKMRALHYALATEKAYRHWIVEFLRFHRTGGQWRHPATLGNLGERKENEKGQA